MFNKKLAKIIDLCSKYTVKERIIFQTIITALIVLSITSFFYSFTIYKLLFAQKHLLLENAMDTAYSTVQYYDQQAKKGEMTTEAAKTQALTELKNIRFLKEKDKKPRGYYFILDFNGTYIMHPIRADLIGKNKINLEDKNKFKVIYNLIKIAKSPIGQGFVTFYWDKPGIDKKYTFPKMGYVRGYKPWGWAIGTGDYIDDIDHQVTKVLLLSLLPCILAVIIIVLAINSTIGRSIIKPIEELTLVSKKLAENDSDVLLKEDDNQTEIGELNRSFQKFAAYVKQKSENEEFISSILTTTLNGIIVIDNEGKIISCNDEGARIFNEQSDEIVGANIIKYIPDLPLETLLLNPNQKENGLYVNLDGRYEITTENNNKTIFLDFTFNKLKMKSKDVFLMVIRNITHHKEVDKTKSEFIATVSHELRTPLTSIKGALGLIVSGKLGDLPEKVKSLLDIANNNCNRLTNLINDILDLEKIKAGKYSFMYEELEINHLLEEAVILNQSYADHFGMRIKLIKLVDEAYIKADKSRILQVISNLISNAVKFSKIDEEVKVISEGNGDEVKVSVIDKGIGISDDSKHKIFQSFSQVDSSDTRTKGGTGLGLSISKLIVENMGGNIGFESQIHQGSTFFFTMPRIEKGSFVKDDYETVQELKEDEF